MPAGALLALATASVAWCVWVALTQETVPAKGRETRGDADFYHSVVDRVHSGENYYDVVASELARRHFVARSLFNWRPPLSAWLIGYLPSILWGQILMALGALTTMFLGYTAVRRDGGAGQAAACMLLMIGPFAWVCSPDVFLFAELWSGLLIALSIGAYAHGRWGVGMGAGLLALFFRELALPYCLICVLLACRQKRRAEVFAWFTGLAVFGLFLIVHALEVHRRLTGAGMLNAQGWIQFAGTSFVLLTSQINYFLILAPAWVTAVYLPLALLGLAGWRGCIGVRAGLTCATYVAAFAVVGIKPSNAYWGFMYAPLLPFGIVWAPMAVRDLVAAVMRSEPKTAALASLALSGSPAPV